ncbi:hypothetical protein ACFS3C_18435 [Azotobacter vinelandii]
MLLKRAPWYFRFSFEDGQLEWSYEFRGVTGIKLAPRKIPDRTGALLIAQERDTDVYGTDQGTKSAKTKKRITADASLSNGIGMVKGEFYVFDRDHDILTKLGDSQLVQNFS